MKEINISDAADAEVEQQEAANQAAIAEGRANVVINATLAFAADYPNQAIAMLSEMLVTITTQLIAANGGDPDAGIQLQGGTRGVTIHPVRQGVLEA